MYLDPAKSVRPELYILNLHISDIMMESPRPFISSSLGKAPKKNVKLGHLAEPPLTPSPLLTWAPLSGNIVFFQHFKAIFKH